VLATVCLLAAESSSHSPVAEAGLAAGWAQLVSQLEAALTQQLEMEQLA